MTKVPCHDYHRCAECGQTWCEAPEIVGKPTTPGGQLHNQKVLMPIEKDVVLFGYGQKLREKVLNAAWTQGLHHGVVYGYSIEFGPFVLTVSNLKCLAAAYGNAVVRIDPGILIARWALIVPNVVEKLVGVCAGFGRDGRRLIMQVCTSGSGAKRILELLPQFDRRPEALLPNEAA